MSTSVVEVVQVGCCRPRSPASDEEWNRTPVGALGRDDRGPLANDEGAMLLLEAFAGELPDAFRAAPRVSTSDRDRADHVRALLADDLARSWRLPDIARAVHCSPFHLARRFRTASGETISGYLLRLRLAAALHRIAEGERNLARLAVELGFSHHSHFSARFRSVFGCTPGRARDALTAPRLRDLRTILTAGVERPT